MSMGDKIKAAAEDLSGKVKEGIGDATDNHRLEAEGKAEQAKADLMRGAADAKEAASDFADKAGAAAHDATSSTNRPDPTA